MKFIPEIEGLRGISVLIILLFHLQYSAFSGGYIGVDIFFVISGFLMTSIIYRQVDEGSFSYKGFLIRRLRRLSPALVFASAITISAASFLFPMGVFKQAISELVAALTYTSNFYFLIGTDYFSEESLRRPFLHTWSLSVEEQFYIFYPLLILTAGSFLRKNIFPLVVMLAAVALAASIISEEVFFYIIPFRAFEFLFGALIAIGYRGLVGTNFGKPDFYAVFLFCMMFIPQGALGTTFSNSLIACLLTALLIASSSSGSVLLTSRPVRYLGNISYSVYLFHWPAIVFVNEAVAPVNTIEGSVLSVLITFVLAVFSRRFVENSLLNSESRYRLAFLALVVPVLFAASFVFIALANQKKPLADVAEWAADPKGMARSTWVYADKFENAEFKGKGHKVLLLGDSNSKDLLNAIYLNYKDTQVSRLGIRHECGVSFSPPIGSHANIKNALDVERCRSEVEGKVSRVNDLSPDLVVISTYWKSNEVDDVFEVVKNIKTDVVVVGPPVFYSKAVPEVIEGLEEGTTLERANLAASSMIHKKVRALDSSLEKKAKKLGVAYVSRYRLMCEGAKCPVISSEGNLIVGDKFHLTIPGAKILGERMLASKSLGIE